MTAGRREIFIKSTEIRVSGEPVVFQTVVGSCVAVCLFDHKARIGGMNHFLLPRYGKKPALGLDAIGKFGDLAVPELLRRLEALGAHRSDVVAKVIGGASILSVSSHNHIPAENIRAARQALAGLSIPVVGQDVGGSKGRKVLFDTGTGQVRVNGGRLL